MDMDHLLDFDTVWGRIKEATDWSKFAEMAAFLSIKGPSITKAKNRGVFPLGWLFKIAQGYQVSTDWLATGKDYGHQSHETASDQGCEISSDPLDPDDEPDIADQWGLEEEEILKLFEKFWSELSIDLKEIVAEDFLEHSPIFAKFVKKSIRRRGQATPHRPAVNE